MTPNHPRLHSLPYTLVSWSLAAQFNQFGTFNFENSSLRTNLVRVCLLELGSSFRTENRRSRNGLKVWRARRALDGQETHINDTFVCLEPTMFSIYYGSSLTFLPSIHTIHIPNRMSAHLFIRYTFLCEYLS